MKTAEFILLIVARKIGIISKDLYAPVPWWFRFAIHDMTSEIDYGCEFDDKDRCHRRNTLGGCCEGCAGSVGYNTLVPGVGIGWIGIKDVLPYMASRFSKKHGFWRPKTGCALPRALRSGTCLRFKCKELNDPFHKWLLYSTASLKEVFNSFRDYLHTKHSLIVTVGIHDEGLVYYGPYIREFMIHYANQKEEERESVNYESAGGNSR